MINYLFKTLILAVFSFVIIYFYYFSNSLHIENFDWYLPYLVVAWIIYGIYKYFQLEISEKKASFSFFKILGFFLLQLLILCILFFTYNKIWIWNWLTLFFKIIFFSIIPISIILISLAFWQKTVSYLPSIKEETSIYNFLISLWVWFFSFVFLLDIFWILGFYNLFIVFLILIWFVAFSYKELLLIFQNIFSYKFELDIEEWSYLRLLSTEFLFIVSTLVLSVSLISIVRPFPIWWDDLWVYMNQPHLMAEAGKIIALWQMYAWQTFTGIGYMFWSPTLAFFMNVVWGFLSFIVLVLVVSDLLHSTSDSKIKTFINIPMLVWTIFISMPMVVFQQAKDMKLDAWLFFVSVITLYLCFKYYLKLSNESYLEKVKSFVNDKILHKSFNISNLLIIIIIWLLAWFAFSIKFTSLLLISGIIWIIFFARLGIIWFLWFLWVFFAIFTKANLWGMMNVVVNPEKIVWFETKFFLVSGWIGVLLLAYAFTKNKKIINKFLLEVGVFILWVLIAILPWLWKNVVESYPNLSVWTLVWWTPERFKFDPKLIYTQEEINKINNEKQRQSISSEWTASNEDLWRYFGYETWINNYVKLPWNLTMQVNQSGEYTDIWFLFLALIPVIFLFLPFRRKEYAYLIVLLLVLELLVSIKGNNKLFENKDLSQISETTKSIIFSPDNFVFEDNKSGKNIYNIDVTNYISASDINKLVTAENTFEAIKKRATELFYEELKAKVLNKDLWKDIVLTSNSLSDVDFELIKELRSLNSNFSTFNNNIDSVVALEKIITKNKLDSEKDALISLWKANRTTNQVISDFFSSFSLPYGYWIILLIFFLPVLFLLFTVDSKDWKENTKLDLFKLNLIFASFYVFLWAISAFWIVWYWITMYFSFLLFIAIWAYYITSYTDEDSEKDFYIKWFGALIFSFIVLVYFVNSVFPHTFSNLKWAWYDQYKTWQVKTDEATYLYHPEYLKILFVTNIAEEKREEFLKENVSDDIEKLVTWIEKMDIYTVSALLKEVIQKYPNLKLSAEKSLDNIYKNISNPSEKYKNKLWIYRIWTFLSYHISENHKRLLEDSLVFNFSDYIYDSNISTTVENLKKLGLWYLLVDLNAPTIDKDERHNLTTRYEKLLSTFTSEDLELVETDSICLKLALEEFDKSKKLSEDRTRFITIAWVNYESYSEQWETINRWTKLMECYKTINDLIKNNKIDNDNYNYLLNISNYIAQNKDKFKTENEIYALLQQQVVSWYKVLFKIK